MDSSRSLGTWVRIAADEMIDPPCKLSSRGAVTQMESRGFGIDGFSEDDLHSRLTALY